MAEPLPVPEAQTSASNTGWTRWIVLAVGSVILILLVVWKNSRPPPTLVPTVAELEVVHPIVSAAGREVRGVVRLAEGAVIEAGPEGTGRLRNDDGTTVILDRGTRVVVRAGATQLTAGRVFVQGVVDVRHELEVSGTKVTLSGATAGIQAGPDGARVYCASEELVVRASAGTEHRVRAGESAVIAGTAVSVEPEKAFDDWTHGMAAPWGAGGLPRRALGELWAIAPDNPAPGTDGSPLTIREHEVEADVFGEAARTRVKTTYFNGGRSTVVGDFRLALPADAIVSRFAWGSGSEELSDGEITIGRGQPTGRFASRPALEWAGEGWVRGHVPSIRSGGTATVLVEYIEWLRPEPVREHRRVQYRYPLVGEGAPPLVGELSVRIDARHAAATALSAGLGAVVQGQAVVLRRSDFRPTADLVVDVDLPNFEAPARLYTAPAQGDPVGDTVFVRTELPAATADEGVTLVLVLDASASIDPALLAVERAVAGAILGSLGQRDRVVVLAADQTVRALGPEQVGPLDDARRQAISQAIEGLAPGGASDLGRALEAAGDALPADAPSGMVVYVGDGWPTLGDATLEGIRARLARRAAGAPRLAAVAVGPLANRPLLAALTRGSGPMLEVADASQAQPAAVRLMVEALRPTFAGVELELEPFVERIYPRAPRAVLAGDTVWAVARVAPNRRPAQVTLKWRDASGPHAERRALASVQTRIPDDVRRRWAAARYEDVMLTGKGKEAAIDVAFRAGLLTPWTAFVNGPEGYTQSRLDTRLLDVSPIIGGAYGTPLGGAGALEGISVEGDDTGDEAELKMAVAVASRRAIDAAGAAIRACRDARATVRPELEGLLLVNVALDGEGRPKQIEVKPASPTIDDAALARCVEVVLQGVTYPRCGFAGEVTVGHTITIPLVVSRQPRKCSDLSRLPMPLRRGPWREELERGAPHEAYLAAKARCELATWSDRRAFLELLLDVKRAGPERLQSATHLDTAGEVDAAEFLRRETVRRAGSPAALREIRRLLLGTEDYPRALFEKQYAAARDDAARLAVVRRFLEVAPHDPRLRRRTLALLEAMNDRAGLVDVIARIRQDPFADALLLADAAATLRRIGEVDEARRAFGELTERAPADPWARAFLGDRLRNEGWFEEASATYQALELLAPEEPAVTLRLALAHHAAGRLDLARRLLVRIGQTGGRSGDAAFGQLATELAAVFLNRAVANAKDPTDVARLKQALAELPLGERGVVVLRSPASELPIRGKLVPTQESARLEREAATPADRLGIYRLDLDPQADRGAKLVLARAATPPPARATHVIIDALLPVPNGVPRLASAEVELPIDGKEVTLVWDGAAWQR